jgi:Sulfotransferase domain
MLPNLVIIGAMKCGTSSLHYYLSLHPEIKMSKQKELDFFIEKYNWHRGLQWYESHFTGQAKIHGEASPNYTTYPRYPGVAQRMYQTIPDAKLIYVVRNPIGRMVSQYIHRYSKGLEERSIEQALAEPDIERNFYLQRSLYYTQLEQYLAYYYPSQIFILNVEELHNNRQKVLEQIFNFLGVEPNFYSPRYEQQLHRSELKRYPTSLGKVLLKVLPQKFTQEMPLPVRWLIENLIYSPFSEPIKQPILTEAFQQKLIELVQEDIQKLQAFTQYDFSHWMTATKKVKV